MSSFASYIFRLLLGTYTLMFVLSPLSFLFISGNAVFFFSKSILTGLLQPPQPPNDVFMSHLVSSNYFQVTCSFIFQVHFSWSYRVRSCLFIHPDNVCLLIGVFSHWTSQLWAQLLWQPPRYRAEAFPDASKWIHYEF